MPRPCCPPHPLLLPLGEQGRGCWHHTLNAPCQTPPQHPRGSDFFFNLITLKNINLCKISLKQPQAPSQSSESVSWRCRTPRAGGERLLLLFLPFLRGDGWRPRPSLLRLRRRAGLRPESPLLPEDSVSCRRRLPCRDASECCCIFLRWCLRGQRESESRDTGDANKVIPGVKRGFWKARRCQCGILVPAMTTRLS